MRDQLAPGDELLAGAKARRSVLVEPASDGAIDAAETRLGVSLPPSYRRFLATSNGAYADTVGAVTAYSVMVTRSQPPGLGFLPVDQIEPLATADPDLYRVWTQQVGSLGGAIGHDGEDVRDFAALTRGSLLIGSADQGATVLVRATRAIEWQLWVFQKETVLGYRSFGSWMRFVTDSLPVSRLREALASYAQGDSVLGHRIIRIRDPRALPILIGALHDGYPCPWVHVIIEALGSIGTADAAIALEPFLVARTDAERRGIRPAPDEQYASGAAELALRRIKGPVAADIQARHGLHEDLARRRDPRAAALALDDLGPPLYRGANSLRLLGDPTYLPMLQTIDRRTAGSDAWFAIVLARHELGDETAVADLEEIAADQSHVRRVNARLLLGLEPWTER